MEANLKKLLVGSYMRLFTVLETLGNQPQMWENVSGQVVIGFRSARLRTALLKAKVNWKYCLIIALFRLLHCKLLKYIMQKRESYCFLSIKYVCTGSGIWSYNNGN